MPVGRAFVNSVESVLTDLPASSREIQFRLVGAHSSRAVRYALTELVKSGRAQHRGRGGRYAGYSIKKERIGIDPRM